MISPFLTALFPSRSLVAAAGAGLRGGNRRCDRAQATGGRCLPSLPRQLLTLFDITTTSALPLEIPSQQTLSLPPRCPITTLAFTSRDAYTARRAMEPRCRCRWSIASPSSSPPPPPPVAAAVAAAVAVTRTRTRARASRRWSLGAADPCPVCSTGTIATAIPPY